MHHLKSFLFPFIIFSFLFFGTDVKAQNTADTTIYVVAQQMPSFPGGYDVMVQYLSGYLKYPEEAVKNRIAGRVFVSFVVEPDGSLSHIKIIKGIGYGCDAEARQVVAGMPKWIPGKNNGKPVRVRYTLPVTFRLQVPQERKIYSHVDVYPLFDAKNYGGIEQFLQSHLCYPVDILSKHIIDTVNIYFVVEPNDSIINVTVNKDTSQWNAYDYEAIRVVKKLSVKAPAYVQNKAVAVRLFVPVIFDYRQADSSSSKIFQTTFNGKTFSYFRQGKVFTIVDHMPSFPGGSTQLMRYLARHISYPKEALKNKEQGRVFVTFIVNNDGTLSHIHIIKGVSPVLDAEAIRVIRNMPRWNPGTRHGKPVRVRFNLPIKFTIK